MFTNKVPWVTSTPASRQIIKTAETPMNVPNKEAAMSLQPPLFPALASTGESAAEPLTDHEMKMLSHLRGLKSMNITLTGDLGLQLEALENREKEVASNKALSHGHLNKYNKVKAQVSAQAKKISSLDAEWSNFVQTTLQKIMMHAEMYQRCRSDLLEVYNQKLEELRRMKAELKLASHSLLEEQHGEPEVLEPSGLAEQVEAMQAALTQVGHVAPVVSLLEDDEEEDLDMKDNGEVQFVNEVKSTGRAHFKGAASPQKVANLHLKTKKEKEKTREG
jgi:regulator of sigma D